MADQRLSNPYREIPAVHRILHDVEALVPQTPRYWIHLAAEGVLDHIRNRVGRNEAVPSYAEILHQVRDRAVELAMPSLRPVVNATGVVIHTNLGRAPLSAEMTAAVVAVAEHYSTLEYQVAAGRRGSRHDHVAALLTQLTGAEAAMVVNNNAAGVLLALSTLAHGKEAVVSRGQLVEIGGSFRIPEVMTLSGAILREVGATNKTHLRDYEQAVSENTALLVKVHTSNFRMVGFVESPETAELVNLGHRLQVPVMEDLGSGSILPIAIGGHQEPTVAEVVAAGVDVVTFSGDKLLGGPQAGLVVGRQAYIQRMKKHPLARAVRVDKMTLAALEVLLRKYLVGEGQHTPLWQMLEASDGVLRSRATGLARRLRRRLGAAMRISVAQDVSEVGGGSLPGSPIPTWVVQMVPLHPATPAHLEHHLRLAPVPVIARIRQEAVIMDVRTILSGQEAIVVDSVAHAVAALGGGASPC